MKDYTLNLCGVTRKLPYVSIDDNKAYASFVILGDVELVKAVGDELAKKIPEVDYIVTAEAKGIPLAFQISSILELKEFIVVRKSIKSYMKDPLCEVVKSITTTERQHLYLDDIDVKKIQGKRICIVDDVISTGESLAAIERLVQRAGGIVSCKAAILAEGDAAKRTDITILDKLPLFEEENNEEYVEIK